jgi:hypothetical protein
MMIPQNHDNPTALASTDPARWQDAQTKAWQEEQRQAARERHEGGATWEESLACLEAWDKWNKQQKEAEQCKPS